MKDSHYQTLGMFIIQTMANLISQESQINIRRGAPGEPAQFDLRVGTYDPARVTIAEADCQAILSDPVGDTTLDLLEIIASEIGITANDIAAAEVLNAIRTGTP